MRRDKTELEHIGLNFEGTVRGRLLRDIPVVDHPKEWPKYARFEIWEDGRDFHIVATTANSIKVEGLVTDLIAAGDELIVRDSGAIDGNYTAAGGNTYSLGITTFPVVEAVGTPTLGEDSTLSTRVVRPSVQWQTFPIVALTATGANGSLTVADPSSFYPPIPICECDMFLKGDSVLIQNSAGGVNDGLWKCRADYTVASAQRTIYLDGYLNPIASGSLGQIILQLPPPQRVAGYGMAVLRWYRAELLADSIVHCRRIDARGDWYEIIAADIGPDDVTPPYI